MHVRSLGAEVSDAPALARSRMYRRGGAYHAVTEAGRADAEREVEAAAHVFQGDVVGQLNDLAVVEMLAEPAE